MSIFLLLKITKGNIIDRRNKQTKKRGIKQMKIQLKENETYATIISYGIINNFTNESIINHFKQKYDLNVLRIEGDLAWYGRGSIVIDKKDQDGIPFDWENELSECFSELEFIEEVV